jgi:hypothetical protein
MLKEHCTPEIITNYKGSGGTYIALHFDFTGVEVPHNYYISSKFNVKFSQESIKSGIVSAYVASTILIDDDYNAIPGNSGSLDYGFWYRNSEYSTTILSDIDNDGDTTEYLAYSTGSNSLTIVDSSQWELIKRVETEYTDDYITTEDDVAYASYGSDYSYQLSITSGNNIIDDLIVYDCLEDGPNSEWNGTFNGLDLSEADDLGLTYTIYYSSNVNAAQDITSSDWTTSMDYSKVKAIAIEFNSQLSKGKTLNVIVNMIAPTDTSLKGKIAENNFNASCTMIDATSNNVIAEGETLESNYVEVTLTSKLLSLYITKRDATDNSLLTAGFSLYKQNEDGSIGDLVETKTTSGGRVTFKMLDSDYKYVLVESTTPTGYVTMENQIVTFDGSNVSLTIKNERKTGTLNVIKKDDFGNLVAGAEYTLYQKDKSEKVGTYITDDNGTFTVTGLDWNTYYLKETKAPTGYELDDNYYAIAITSSNLTIEKNVTDIGKKGSVILTKTDDTKTNFLQGAFFSLFTEAGTLVSSGLETDENGQIRVDNLSFGSYYFVETKAPTGYVLSTKKIKFTIDASNVSSVKYLTTTNTKDFYEVTVTKKIKASDINFANGTPSFIFKMSGVDINGEEHTYYSIITFDKAYVDANTQSDGYVSQSISFTDFLPGEYTVKEEETSRYALSEITDVKHGTINDDSVEFDLVNYYKASATFTNEKYENQFYSDAKTIVNKILKK